MARKSPTSTGRNGGQMYADKMPRQAPKPAAGKRGTPPSPKGKA